LPIADERFARLFDQLVGDGFSDITGTDLSITLPVSKRLLNELVAAATPPSAPVRDLDLTPLDNDRFLLRGRIGSSALLPALRLNLEIDQQPVLLGWANNWTYAQDIPTFPWKSAMSLPRDLSLKKTNGEWLLIQKPVEALKKLRTDPAELKNISVADKKELGLRGQQFEMEFSFQPVTNSTAGLHLAVGKQNVFVIGYNASSQKLFVDRSRCINDSFNKEFASLSHFETSLTPVNEKIKLHIFLDHSIVEVFANDGAAVMTAQIFPDENDNGVELFSDGGTTRFDRVRLWKMKSAW